MQGSKSKELPAVHDSVKYVVEHVEPRSIVLNGDWGVGKTYYWRETAVKDFLANANFKRVQRGYAYASLFGLESIQQIKNALAYSYAENEPLGNFLALWQKVKMYCRKVGAFFNRSFVDEAGVDITGVGLKVKVNTLTNDFAFLSIRRALVCFDDIERRNSKLSMRDVLGLVSYLVDQRGCRVVLLLNYDALEPADKLEWDLSKDKVFDSEMVFKPTAAQSIEIGLMGTEHEPWHETVKLGLARLEISNVRVAAKAQRFVKQIFIELKQAPELSDLKEDAWNEIAKAATLLSAAHASRGVGAPDIGEIVNPKFSMNNDDKAKIAMSPAQKIWLENIKNYGVYLGDGLDKAIARSVQDGFPNSAELTRQAVIWSANQEQQESRKKFQSAWDKYHNSFDDDADEVANAFIGSLPGVIGFESVHNIEATANLLRLLGHHKEATETLNAWVDARKTSRRAELFQESFFPGTVVSDPEFIAILDAARAEHPQAIMPLDIALTQLNSNSWSDEAVEAISIAEADDIAEILSNSKQDWRSCIGTMSTYNLHGEMGKLARLNFLNALKMVFDSSTLNASRVQNKLSGVDLQSLLAATAKNISQT